VTNPPERVNEGACGNGVVEGDEACDDGNTNTGDGCSPICAWEFCGDGLTGALLWKQEEFNSGSMVALPWQTQGAHSFRLETGIGREGSPGLAPTNSNQPSSEAVLSLQQYTVGNICFWVAGQSELCCDHLRFEVDGTVLDEWSGDQSTWQEYCYALPPGDHLFTWRYRKDGSGDVGWDAFYLDSVRIKAPFEEECDDGNRADGDGCSSHCLREQCGNGSVEGTEECDDGNVDDGDQCSHRCTLPTCGDGIRDWSRPTEGFEGGDLTQLPWQTGTGTSSFRPLAGEGAVAGDYALFSQNAGHHTSRAWVQVPLTLAEAGEVCFWYAGVSESGWDKFRFLIDGEVFLERDGTVTWRQNCTTVTAGSHLFGWEYVKDGSVSTGADRFMIDALEFPPALERCDDGNLDGGDGCGSNCQVEPSP
jgi:cysteine-rich repeat protein